MTQALRRQTLPSLQNMSVTSFELSNPPELYNSKLIKSFYWCWQVFPDSYTEQDNYVKLMRLCWGNLQQKGITVEREKWSKALLHFMNKDDNNTGCLACKMIIGMSEMGWLHYTEIILGCHISDTQHTSATASQPNSTSVSEGKYIVIIALVP